MLKQAMVWLLSFLFISTCAAQNSIKSLMPLDKRITPSPKYKVINNHFNFSQIVKAGGFGGNIHRGKVIYDGDTYLPALTVSRHHKDCYLKNENTQIINTQDGHIIKFDCDNTDPAHHNLYWSGELGKVNGGYSPENDTLYAVDVIVNMFDDWYQIPPVTKNELQTPIMIYLHDHEDSAYIDEDNAIHFGDGKRYFYPLTSLSIVSVMVGFLFTDQHSNLDFYSQSGAISVAFSNMTAMAAEFYVTGKNTWQIGGDVAKNGEPLHYMDQPSKNCHGKKPGDFCGIDTLAQYYDWLNVWNASGLFNRAFYLLATTKGWDTHKAYDVFLNANLYFWYRSTDFQEGACGAVSAAKRLGYDTMSVMIAFSAVGIDTRDC